MNKKAEFAVKLLKQYAFETQQVKSTSDLSPLEKWLIFQLFFAEKKNQHASEMYHVLESVQDIWPLIPDGLLFDVKNVLYKVKKF